MIAGESILLLRGQVTRRDPIEKLSTS